jgi:hypothetical protein
VSSLQGVPGSRNDRACDEFFHLAAAAEGGIGCERRGQGIHPATTVSFFGLRDTDSMGAKDVLPLLPMFSSSPLASSILAVSMLRFLDA